MTLTSGLLLAALLQTPSLDPDRVEVEPARLILEVDESRALSATAYDADEAPIPDARVRWMAVDGDILSVDSRGTVTALRPGAGRIAAVVEGAVGFARIEVPELPPAEIEVGLPDVELLPGISAPLEVTARTRLGAPLEAPDLRFESADPEIAGVDSSGRIFARSVGETVIRVRGGSAEASLPVRVTSPRPLEFRLVPVSRTVRTGDVVRFRVEAREEGGGEGPSVSPAWSVSGAGARIEAEGREGVFVAEGPGTYRVTAQVGEETMRSGWVRVEARTHEARLVKVGRGAVSDHHSGDMWVFEGLDGRDYVYVGTFHYDWLKVWDVTDPRSPVLTDSVRVDARRINDVKIHPAGHVGVMTREGASDRRNGIVLLDLTDPAHPSIASEYRETLTGGVHNVWVDGEHDLVYACHNGTSDLHIIDISDPRSPREAGRWGLDKTDKTLHDAIVQDGYAYLSYWDDGVITLDVGAGTHGGTPTAPVFVSQFKYPTGNTHTAWRHGDYLFVGDEIFPEDWDPNRPIEARGYVHVVDYSDIENPREVAHYEVPEAGAHNVWVEENRLYVGYYQAGLRVVDISGELRGDLYRQGREVARFKPVDEEMVVPNWPMTWGAQLHKGLIYSSDMNSGLWITRLDEESRPVF